MIYIMLAVESQPVLYYESKEIREVTIMEMAKVTAKGQITIPIDVRRRLGLNEGSRMLFIEYENGFFVVNENRIDMDTLRGAKVRTTYKGWPEDYVKALMAFDTPSAPLFEEHEDIPWTEREELL
jgi:AbrB family looped-hinge helix DNA binding protein